MPSTTATHPQLHSAMPPHPQTAFFALHAQSLQTLQALSWLAAFFAMAWGRCILALSRWAACTSLLVLLHGGLRRAGSEGGGGRCGVTFRQVLGLECAPYSVFISRLPLEAVQASCQQANRSWGRTSLYCEFLCSRLRCRGVARLLIKCDSPAWSAARLIQTPGGCSGSCGMWHGLGRAMQPETPVPGAAARCCWPRRFSQDSCSGCERGNPLRMCT